MSGAAVGAGVGGGGGGGCVWANPTELPSNADDKLMHTRMARVRESDADLGSARRVGVSIGVSPFNRTLRG